MTTDDDQDDTEMRRLVRELFAEVDETADPDEDDRGDTRPANQVRVEGGNPAATRVDDLREFARQLFNPA